MKYNQRQLLYVILSTFISLILAYVTINYLIEYSSFGIGLLKFSIAIVLWYFMDVYVFKDIDTINELKKNNISVGIVFGAFLIAVAIIIGNS